MFRNRRLFLRFVAAGLCLGSLLFWTFSPTSASSNLPLAAGGTSTPRGLPCHDLPGGQETLFILRTGATEIADRLPAHIATSLRCFQNHIVFSDFEERFQDENVLDALESVDPQIIANNQGFELYRRLQRDGRAGLSPSELSGNEAQTLSDSGHSEIPGWKLDKWKFVPMVNRTLFEYPDMNWYVFMEADSFILWSTLQLYLFKMDPTKPHYLGVDTYIGDDPAFAHGGAGFMVSRPAMRMVVDYYAEHKAEIEARTDSHWAGDAVLGITFKNAGVPLTSVWPLVHGESTGHAFFARSGSPGVPKEYKQVWCYPAGTYHHMSSAAVDSLWHFEQKWLEQREKDTDVLRHKDIFKHYVMPQMSGVRTNWDNLNDGRETEANSLGECRAACEKDSTCRQYSYDPDGKCTTRVNPRLGIPSNGTTSGWMEDRVAAFERDMAPCEKEGFDSLPGSV